MADTSSPQTLILRADAGPLIGSGHVTRCLALAEAWTSSGGRAVLVASQPSDAVRVRAAASGASVLEVRGPYPDPSDLEALRSAIAVSGGRPWAAVDGYRFDPEYLSSARAAGARLLVLDDSVRLSEYPADALLDQNAGAENRDYPLPKGALPLLGPRWALLRPGFSRVGATRKMRPQGTRLLVSFGGSDPDNATSLALCALRKLTRAFEAVAVIGPDNPRAEELREQAAGLPVRFETAADMTLLMEWADLGLISGGVTMLEACAAGLPAAVVTIAENQQPGAGAMAGRGAVRLLGGPAQPSQAALSETLEALLADGPAREALSVAGRAVCDGAGAHRVVEALRALSAPKLAAAHVQFRPAEAEDALDVWRIANDPTVRRNSFNRDGIPLPVHLAWYRERLADPASRFWLIVAGGVVAAQVRYAKEGDEAEVHYSVLPAFRGKGLGTLALEASRRLACRELAVRRLVGSVITPNAASERSFISAGWTRRGVETRDGKACAVFEAAC